MKTVFTIFIMLVTNICLVHGQCFSIQNYSNPGVTNWTVPGGSGDTYQIEIEVRGGDGGDFLWGVNPSSAGGAGATLRGAFTVHGGDQMMIVVGQSGFDAIGSPGGGGGGGGSAVVINNSEVLIAAGAGGGGGQNTLGQGAGANTNSVPQGGAGPGASGGGGFNSAGMNGLAGSGGGAGTLFGQGSGGAQGVVAGPGGNGFGGGGGGSGTGGGGGGGYRGGDGAATGSLNGKGGDSFVTLLFNGSVVFANPGATGGGSGQNGAVIIECTGTMASTLDITIDNQQDPTCFGSADGFIEVSASGGATPYMYSINGGPTQSSGLFNNLNGGTYTIEVVDNNGETADVTTILTEPNQLSGSTIQVVDNTCFGDMNGSIEVIGIGGSGSYQYSLNGGTVQSSGQFTDLGSGTYTITIIDGNNCSFDIVEIISSLPEIQVQILSQTNVSCFGDSDGSVMVFADGGSGGITYSLDGINFQISDQFNNLSASTYIVTAMDNSGCTGDLSFAITEPSELVGTVSVTNASCGSNTGSALINPVGGTAPYTYSLDNVTFTSSNQFVNLAAGMYLAYIKDSNDCIASLPFEISGSGEMIMIMGQFMHPTCHSSNGNPNGTIDISVSGGTMPYQYNWSTIDGLSVDTMAQDQAGLSPGTYTVTISDANGCSAVASWTLLGADEIIVDAVIADLSCNANDGAPTGEISISTMGGIPPYQYLWSTSDGSGLLISEPNQSGLSAGTYSLLVMDSLGCMWQSSYTLVQPNAIQVQDSIVAPTCHFNNGGTDGSIQIAVTGGTTPFSFSWTTSDGSGIDPTAQNQNNLNAGNYALTVTDANNCSTTAEYIVTQPAELNLSLFTIDANCSTNENGSITMSATGGTSPYTYTVVGTNTNGEFTDLVAGTYNASVVDSLGCTLDTVVQILNAGDIAVDTVNEKMVSCHNGSDGVIEVILNNSGAYTFTLNDSTNSTGIFNSLSAGDYTILVQDTNGCESFIMVTILEPEPLVLVLDTSGIEVAGNDAFITVSANGGTPPYQYALNDRNKLQSTGEFTGLTNGVYTVYVLDSNGCESEMEVIIMNTGSDETILKDILVSPNPASEFINLNFGNKLPYSPKIQIFNLLGEQQICQTEYTDEETIRLNVSDIPNGLFLININIGLQSISRKIIIKH